jgi:uncharacterized membrane protein
LAEGPSGYQSLGGGHIAYLVETESEMSSTVLWIIAAILVVVGIVQLLQGQILLGIAMIAGGCVVGPGGYSIFRNRGN